MRALVPQLLRRRRPDAVIAHMCPIYLVLAAPLAKLVRVPLALWYTHWTIDRTLRLATRSRTSALSVDRRSYPIADPKVLGIGHGIDVAQFAARDGAPAGTGRCGCSRSAGRRRRRGSPRSSGRARSPARRASNCRSRSTAPRRRTRSGGTGASSRR